MNNPTVSIVIPTCNRAALLPRALDSVVRQTFSDWEIVLVDDGSRDATADVAARYAKELGDRFVYVYQANSGSSRARNHGIDVSRGAFVAFLDSDDEFLSTKLARQMALFDHCPELGFVYCDYAYVDLDGRRYASTFDCKHPIARDVPTQIVAPGLEVCTGDLFDWLIRGYFISTIAGLVRREVLGSAIRFPEDQSFGEEWHFYLRVARACRAGFVNESLAVYHYQHGSLARTDKAANASRYRHLLRAIHRTFDHLTVEQRQAVRRHLAVLCRQLGHRAYRAGRHGEAMVRFAESCRYEPRFTTLGEVLQSAVRWPAAVLGRGVAPPRPTQDGWPVVR